MRLVFIIIVVILVIISLSVLYFKTIENFPYSTSSFRPRHYTYPYRRWNRYTNRVYDRDYYPYSTLDTLYGYYPPILLPTYYNNYRYTNIPNYTYGYY